MSTGQDFWSRRRARVEAEEARIAADEKAAIAARAERENDIELADLTEAEILAKLELPDPDSVASGETLQKFMAQGVPGYLRRRAMRALWRSNPIFANLDGLIDYGEDYTDAATVMPDLKTAYQVGKGMIKHLEHLAAKEAPEGSEEDEQAKQADLEGYDLAETQHEEIRTDAAADDRDPLLEPKEDLHYEKIYRPRRMKFRVEGEKATA